MSADTLRTSPAYLNAERHYPELAVLFLPDTADHRAVVDAVFDTKLALSHEAAPRVILDPELVEAASVALGALERLYLGEADDLSLN